MNEHTWLVLGVALTAFPGIAFPVVYGLMAPWWRSAIGRSIFIYSLGMALLITSSIARLWFGDGDPLFIYFRLAIYTILPFGLWYLFWALIKTLWRAYRVTRVPWVPEDLSDHIGPRRP